MSWGLRLCRVGLPRVPVQAAGIISIGKAKTRFSCESSRTLAWRIRNQSGRKAGQHRLNKRSVGRRVVSRSLFEPIGGIALAGKEHIAGVSLRARILSLIEAYEAEQSILYDRKTCSEAILIAAVYRFLNPWTYDIPRRVQSAVVVKPISIPVNVIGAGDRLHQNNRPITTPELGGKAVSQRLKFLDGRERCALTVLVL